MKNHLFEDQPLFIEGYSRISVLERRYGYRVIGFLLRSD